MTDANRQPSFRPQFRPPLIGRQAQLQSLIQALRARRSCLIWGPAGIGKTRLVEEALAMAGLPFLLVEGPRVLHSLLVQLSEQCGCYAGALRGRRHPTSIALKGELRESLRLAPRCVVLEDVSHADARTYRFLQQIYYLPGNCLLVTAASRADLGHLGKLLWDPREEIALRSLSAREAARLFDAAARWHGLDSFDVASFRKQALAAAKGNPGQILTMCRLASLPEYQDGRHIKFLPLRMDTLTALVC